VQKFYAHSIDGKTVDDWHRLEEHLKGTAELAASFAAEFGCEEWGRIAGLWHDLGKYSEGELL
jgi:CRISPR-associated endonuclease/helicase Cas3